MKTLHGRVRAWRTWAIMVGAVAAAGAGTVRPAAANDATGAGAAGISATGTAKVERWPELVRIQFALSAEGTDVKDALTKLRAKEAAAKQKLAKLGVAEAGVKVDEPQLGTAGAGGGQDEQAAVEQMLRARLGGGRPGKPATGPAGGAAAAAVRVSSGVRAELPLKAKDLDELLAEAHDLAAKVKAADLADRSGPAASPEEDELRQEREMMLQQMGRRGGNPEAATGGVTTLFVVRVSPEERAKATAEAFARARGDAERLAAAAGGQLGRVRTLAATAGGDSGDGGDEMAMRMRFGYVPPQYAARRGGDDPDRPEASGAAPAMLTYTVAVSATFELK